MYLTYRHTYSYVCDNNFLYSLYIYDNRFFYKPSFSYYYFLYNHSVHIDRTKTLLPILSSYDRPLKRRNLSVS